MSLDNHYYNLESDSKIKIKYKFSTIFHFTSEPEIHFATYLSNIGGLIGLWFGFSFIDISIFFQLIFNYIRFNIEKLITKLKSLLNRLLIALLIQDIILKLLIFMKTILIKVQRFNWRAFITLITIPIILMQFIDLIQTYLQFSTQINFDLITYRGIDKNIPITKFPAIMICFRFLYDKIIFHQNNLEHIALMTNNQSLSVIDIMNNKFGSNHEIAIDVIIQNLNVSKIFEYKDTLKQIAYDHVHSIINFKNYEEFEDNYELTHNKNISGFEHIFKDFLIFKSIIEYTDYGLGDSGSESKHLPMITPFGQCISFQKGRQNSDTDQNIPDSFTSLQGYLKGRNRQSMLNYIEFEILLHSTDSFPLLTAEEIYLTDDNVYYGNSFVLKLSRYEFERLPKPYETNCHNFGNSNRFQCLNDCYFNAYMNRIKCIPNYNSLLTIDLSNYSHYIFCQNDDKQRINKINRDINIECKIICPDSCKDILFLAKYQGWKVLEDQKIFINFEENYYHVIKYLAKMTFLQMIISLVNVSNAWHGMSINRAWVLLLLIFSKFPKIKHLSEIFDRIRILNNEINFCKSKIKVSININFDNELTHFFKFRFYSHYL